MDHPITFSDLLNTFAAGLNADISYLLDPWIWQWVLPGLILSGWLIAKWFLLSMLFTSPIWVPLAVVAAVYRASAPDTFVDYYEDDPEAENVMPPQTKH